MGPALIARRTLLAFAACAGAAHALGRTPYGGRLRLKIPWPVDGLDPHAIDDPTAALFGDAIADPLYARDERGRPYAALAAALPETTAHGARVTLRPGLVTARGRALDSRDVVWSLERAARAGAAALLAPFGRPVRDNGDPLAVLVPGAHPAALAAALSSPVTAILPRAFSRGAPDGTGAFTAYPSGDKLALRRNLHAARGASFLDAVDVARATDLSDALRSFEAGEVDVGWLGRGLHQPRPGAVAFDAGMFGWAVLRGGADAGSWGAPGVLQQLLDRIPASRLSYLGVSGLPAGGGDHAWGGAPADLLVADDAPHLLEIARALAALLDAPGHEVRPVPRPARELDARKRSRRFALMLDFARPIGPPGADTLLALLTAANPELARRPPRLSTSDPREIARTLSLGVVGELRVGGAHMPDFIGLERWQLGAVWKK